MSDGMTVTDLAAVVGMTPRNIRAYQSRGLLFPPQIRGRKARYTAGHVARLQLIMSLQREGFTLAAIKRLLEHPDSDASVMDFEHGLVRQQHGELRTHTLLAGMSRTLHEQGVSAELLGELLIEVAQAGSRIGAVFAARVRGTDPVDGHPRPADIALLTSQLLATGFEVTCARAATAAEAASS